MRKIFRECLRVLKKGKYCVCIISDIRKGKLYPLHSYLTEIAEIEGFDLWDTIINFRNIGSIVSQRHRNAVNRGYSVRIHEFGLVFKK